MFVCCLFRILFCLNGIDADVYLVDEPTNYLQEDKKQIIFEILNNTKAVANLIANNKLNQIPSLIESGIENYMIAKEKYFKKIEIESD